MMGCVNMRKNIANTELEAFCEACEPACSRRLTPAREPEALCEACEPASAHEPTLAQPASACERESVDAARPTPFASLRLHPANCVLAVASSAVIAFGLYNVHSFSSITEGGVLGLTLLLNYWFNVSPAVTNFVISALCYALGWRLLGRTFMAYSVIATVSYSAFYAIFERFDPVWPQLANMPLAACIIGAIFVGVGAGFCVRAGGAQCGDDALAMSISHVSGVGIQWIYLVSDLVVLGLSLTYIPLERIVFSLITVILSGQIIGWIQKIKLPWEDRSLK